MAPKLPKLEEELGEDRISQMPNDVLVRILSLLDDSVLAVQTTILSKRWNNLWTSISSIRLGDFDHECDDHFMTFVDSVVSLHNSTDILKFGLIYNNEGSRNDMLADDYTHYGADDGIADRATALFAQISNVEDLSLSLQGLNASYLPEFVNLSRLVLVLHGFNYWEFLIECRKICPNLKHLDLKHEDNKWHRRKYELQWEFFNPQERPACLVSHLKTISIKGFKGQRDEMEVAEYLLKNGEVLNRMSIHTESEDLLCTKKKLYKKLLTYVRGSRSCVILAD
ncbi:hypothetical protein ACLB2K_070260 [Fragaria x ananassa]